MKSNFCVLFIFVALVFGRGNAEAGFDWGGGGYLIQANESFVTQTEAKEVVVVGEIPAGISGVEIHLVSTHDVDIQLYDKETNKEIVAWPNGIINDASPTTANYEGVTIEYSGYNGYPTGNLGNEYIKIFDMTNRPLIIKLFGYAAGSVEVRYTWSNWKDTQNTQKIVQLEAQLAKITAERDAAATAAAADKLTAVAAARTAGQADVTDDPASYSLVTQVAYDAAATAAATAADTAAADKLTAVAAARTAGQADVTTAPASYSFVTQASYAAVEAERDAAIAERDARFTKDQIRTMSVDHTVGQNEAGNMQVKIAFIQSTNLNTYTPFTVIPDSLSVVDGKICMEFPPSDAENFFFRFRIE
jgi:hypothetical protein